MKPNITMIGMPSSGKSTIGVLLAKRLGFSFVDVDIVIQEKEGALPVIRAMRRASAPYLSMTSRGSMPLPRDLLIFRPSESLTRP